MKENRLEKDIESKKEIMWQADLENGKYKNPVLYADYSDPDVIRVGDTYYMTASSFNYMPGLPILTSHDLINWKLVNYAVKNIPYEIYNTPAHAKGIWAPSIRYYNKKFWIFVGMPDEGIFMTCTKDPLQEWEPLICVWEGKGFIDPCPIWDEDGKAYVVHAYANSRIGIKSKLGIFEINQEGTKCLSEDKVIFDGTKTQPTIEGPKIYKKDGFYYIFAPAGGVRPGWQTVLRSKSIDGPYEEKIVMHQGDSQVNGPHQGGLVDTPSGQEWFLHFQQKGAYGRIIHLQPVKWEQGWPMIGIDSNGDGIGEPVTIYQKPEGTVSYEICEPETTDYFDTNQLKLQWQWLANFDESFYSLQESVGKLCLYPMNTSKQKKALIWNSANVLTQKIVCPNLTAVTKIDVSQMGIGSRSGILLIGAQYAALYLERDEQGYHIAYLESKGDGETREEEYLIRYEEIQTTSLYLRVEFSEKEIGQFSFSEDGENFKRISREFSPLEAVWVGAKVGVFAISDEDKKQENKVFFEYFKMKPEIEENK